MAWNPGFQNVNAVLRYVILENAVDIYIYMLFSSTQKITPPSSLA
jgi:hypothetical protein